MIGGRNGQQIGYRPAVTAAGLAEPERTACSSTVRVTRPEAPVAASLAGSARDLERHDHPITNPPLDRVVAACAYDRIGKDSRLVEVAVQTSDIAPKDQKKLSEILAKCVVDTATTTTTKGADE